MKLYSCVTGADRGLGFELAKALLEDGYTVFAGRYNKDWKLLDKLSEKYPDSLYIVDLDVSSDTSVKAAAEFISSRTDRIDVLVNNSAISGNYDPTIFDELDFDEMLRVFNVNCLGATRVTNALIRLIMNSEKKLIMNISSEAGSISTCYRKGWFAYCGSKAALNMHSAIVHNNIKEHGGQVILIHPGWMKSWLTGEYRDEAPLTPDIPAKKLIGIIRNPERYKGERPAFIDYEGNKWEF
ncbi:MAG TPA: SDR family NAD(P)-dependent oxidoreductase [Clostridiales bacterium]|nr:SDR family NAD(P)-dependent oxidoreductase [Clostridiales bacterium]HOL90680.1 SDR family NAD(P)-dependent oxidoreductase [Clostridiales bacterium]HPP34778.1 SDR family NAD(P)-dependent oxidoreductase [Clostridiales bacterium]